jgi:Family of unknown function (DUF6328)
MPDGVENAKERTDRQLDELLSELRVAIPGAQVLLGFLLTVPFATRFGLTTRVERWTLFACFLLTVAGTILLMAPSVYHRRRWGRGGKSDVVLVAHRMFLAGSACLGAAIVVAVFLIGDVLFGTALAAVSAAFVGLGVVLTWDTLPRVRSRSPSIRSLE